MCGASNMMLIGDDILDPGFSSSSSTRRSREIETSIIAIEQLGVAISCLVLDMRFYKMIQQLTDLHPFFHF